MAAGNQPDFAGLLRDARMNAGLTQEELAEAAGVSARAVSNLERGINRYPHKYTRDLLAEALEVSPDGRKAWDAACQRRRSPANRPGADSAVKNEWPDVHHLPVPTTRLIGRDTEVEQLFEHIRQPDVRLLTLTGSGGVGKTRLSLGVIEALHEEFPDGIYFVELAAVRDPTLVDSAIASTIGLRQARDQNLPETIASYLRFRRVLLVLDNFEHVIDSAPVVSYLLSSCPMLKVLVTSRAALHLHGEHEIALSPLALPQDIAVSVEDSKRSPAVALFVERAQMVKSDFSINEQNADDVVAICRRLDGIPLAIELAAAKVKLIPPKELWEHLQRPLTFLAGDLRDAPKRQRTLRDTIAWSYGLLSTDEQRLLNQLSVFVGGWTLSAAEAVCEVGSDFIATVGALVDHSLLAQRENDDGTARFSMLETVREFGLEQLEHSGELEHARERHARYFVRLVEEARPDLRNGPNMRLRLDQVEREFENIRSAFNWLVERNDADAAARTVVALGAFWPVRSRLRELSRWAESIVSLDGNIAPGLEGELLGWLGASFNERGEYEKASRHLKRSIELCRTANNKEGLWNAHSWLTANALHRGDYDFAAELSERSLAIAHELTDRMLIGRSLGHLSHLTAIDGDYRHAEELSHQWLRYATEVGDHVGREFALAYLGYLALWEDDLATVEQRALECFQASRELGHHDMTAVALEVLGHVELGRSNFESAQRLYRESIEGFWRSQGPLWRNLSIHELAGAAAGLGDFERGARLLGVAEKIIEQVGTAKPPYWEIRYQPIIQAVRAGLDETTFEAAMAEGRSWPLEQGVAYALGITDERADRSDVTIDHVFR